MIAFLAVNDPRPRHFSRFGPTPDLEGAFRLWAVFLALPWRQKFVRADESGSALPSAS